MPSLSTLLGSNFLGISGFPSGSIVGTSEVQTITNKNIIPRTNSTVSFGSPLTWNSDQYDVYAATSQASDVTIDVDSGNPADGQKIMFRVRCDGTNRNITFIGGSSKGFNRVGANLTLSGSNFTYALTNNKTTYFACMYNTGTSRWDVVGISQES